MKKQIKKLFMLFVFFCSCTKGKAQDDPASYGVVAIGAGYSISNNAKYITLLPEFGYRTGNLYLNVRPQINLNNVSYIPVVLPLNVGYNIGQFQPFVSASYQTIGAEGEAYFKGTKYEFTNGFKAGGGISYYFDNFPVQMTLQRQGKINNLSIIIYTHL